MHCFQELLQSFQLSAATISLLQADLQQKDLQLAAANTLQEGHAATISQLQAAIHEKDLQLEHLQCMLDDAKQNASKWRQTARLLSKKIKKDVSEKVI